jgi:hypothetical protein
MEESLSYFSPEFLVKFFDKEIISREEHILKLKELQEEDNELAEEYIRKNLTCELDEVYRGAIAIDGRGHFLNSYDGHEYEEEVCGTTYFIYE